VAPIVEFLIDGNWVSVSARVLHGQKVDIGRRAGWQAVDAAFSSGTCAFVLLNLPDPVTGVGPFSIFHPLATYYGRVGEGTPVRVTASVSLRFWGEISSFEVDADLSGRAGWVDVVALGALGRYEGDDKAIGSPATRAILSPDNNTTRVAYWPLEEETLADGIRSPVGSPPILVVGDVEFGNNSSSPATERMLTFGADGQLQASIPAYTSTGEVKVCTTWFIPETEVPDNTRLYRLYFTGGTVGWIDLRYSTGGTLRADFFVGGVLFDTAMNVTMGPFIIDRDSFLSLELAQDGADIDVLVLAVSAVTTGVSLSDTVTGQTLGTISRIIVAQTPCDGVSFGQLLVGNDTGAFASYISPTPTGGLGTRGFTGESGAGRIDRLTGEHNLFSTVRTANLSVAGVGVQSIAGLVETLSEAANADGGMLFEARNLLSVGYVDRWSLHNQLPKVTLDYSASTFASQLKPTRDPAAARNDVTVSRVDGGTGTYTIPDGDPYHRSTEPPPAGIGTRPGQLTLKLDEDRRARSMAGWYAHLGSHNDPGYGQITVKLHAPTFAADTALRDQVVDVDIGDVIRVTNPPSWCPPGYFDLLVHGITEVADIDIHEITFDVVPAQPWEVWPVNSAGTTVAVAVDADDTTLPLAVSSGPGWSSAAVPYHIHDGGEAMTVTSMATQTPAYIAASAAAAAADNASISPALPAGITPNVAQLLLIWATIRNSGTGTVNTPAGWRKVVDFGNTALLGRYYVTGDVAPTVTFTGGVVGATTLGRMFAFSGLSMELVSGTKQTPAAATQLNGVTQNIAFPAMTIPSGRTGTALIFAWKQDDWTSLGSPPAGFTTVSADASTTGDDAGIWAAYDLTGTSGLAGSISVTGGATAISRAVVLALRPIETATVIRGVNDVALSHAVGEAVDAWRPGATAA
jgi:hypothetical protein